jgi:hypothetical protein
MAAKYIIAYFLEDIGQEAIIPPLVRRLIREAGKPAVNFDHRTLNARGGRSISAYKDFLADAKSKMHLPADLLIVGSDGNCKGFATCRDEITAVAANPPYPIVVTAVPDPHVERWYLLDPSALSKAAGIPKMPALPAHKCEKNYYKHLLRSAFNNSPIVPLLGGTEYGPLVADEMDLYAASKVDHGLAEFVGGVKSWLKQLP